MNDEGSLAGLISGLAAASCVLPTLAPNHIICANPAFFELTGFGEEIVGQSLRHLQGEGTNPRVFKELLASIQLSDPSIVTLTSYTKQKRPFLNRIEIMPVRNTDNVVTHHVLKMTEQKTSQPFVCNPAGSLPCFPNKPELTPVGSLKQPTQSDTRSPFPNDLKPSTVGSLKRTMQSDTQSETCSEQTSEGSEQTSEDDDLGHLFLCEFDSNPFSEFLDMDQKSRDGGGSQVPNEFHAQLQSLQHVHQQAGEMQTALLGASPAFAIGSTSEPPLKKKRIRLEDPVARKERQKERNRTQAKVSRLRKKVLISTLEERNRELTERNLELQKLVIKYAPPAESKAALALCENQFSPSELNMDASGALYR